MTCKTNYNYITVLDKRDTSPFWLQYRLFCMAGYYHLEVYTCQLHISIPPCPQPGIQLLACTASDDIDLAQGYIPLRIPGLEFAGSDPAMEIFVE